ncbi:IPT/TIG domain-containing protein [Streptomyces oryzae]|uniref:IPT/TIG domain-containing protein n=2 Tax=Streptomyces oryzae TaxID=1434886 RepID=A0ABS3XGX0_9ACTN|nr:IPT/TIG domain-containing protein [Streptomyces oryzae]
MLNVGSQPALNQPGQNSLWPLPPFPTQSPPMLLAAVPNSGPTTGGNTVLLIGMGLSNVTNVSFGGTPAIVLSQDFPLGLLVSVSAPAHAAGTVPVTVTTTAGTSNAVNYTYQAPALPPTAASIVPTSGPVTGGTPFTITGTNLTGANVLFGGVPATGVVVDPSGNSLTGVTPPGIAPGNVPVTVITPNGTATVPGGFTYLAVTPTADSIVPTSGPVTGGTPFTITGTNLTSANVLFGGLPATGVVVDPSGNSLTGVTPAGLAPGNVTVTVVTPNGTANVPGGFTYTAVAPTADTITPNSGPAAGGTPFVITGTGLTGGSVTIGGNAATGVTVDPTGTLLFGTAPAGTVGNQPVVVTTPGGTATVPGGFTYV